MMTQSIKKSVTFVWFFLSRAGTLSLIYFYNNLETPSRIRLHVAAIMPINPKVGTHPVPVLVLSVSSHLIMPQENSSNSPP